MERGHFARATSLFPSLCHSQIRCDAIVLCEHLLLVGVSCLLIYMTLEFLSIGGCLGTSEITLEMILPVNGTHFCLSRTVLQNLRARMCSSKARQVQPSLYQAMEDLEWMTLQSLQRCAHKPFSKPWIEQ